MKILSGTGRPRALNTWCGPGQPISDKDFMVTSRPNQKSIFLSLAGDGIARWKFYTTRVYNRKRMHGHGIPIPWNYEVCFYLSKYTHVITLNNLDQKKKRGRWPFYIVWPSVQFEKKIVTSIVEGEQLPKTKALSMYLPSSPSDSLVSK